MLRAKRAMEELLQVGTVFVELPTVEDPTILASELADAGITAAPVSSPQSVDVRSARERLGLTREQFAARHGLELEMLRNWEVSRREPDQIARSYLQAIANDPQCVAQAHAATAPR